MNEANGERVLSLNLKDCAANSILYAYVFARGVESTSPYTDDVLSLATLLNNNPDPKTDTATQDWQQFLGWTDPITDEKGLAHNCTIDELELTMKGAGYEVAAVILRKLPDAERESWHQVFLNYKKKTIEQRKSSSMAPEAVAQRMERSYRHDPYVEVTRTGATVTFTEKPSRGGGKAVLNRSSKFKGILETRFKCECNTHEIEVAQWQNGEWEDNNVYLEFWYRGRNWSSATQKLISIWRILRGLSVHQEEIALTPREAHRLGRALLRVEGPDNPRTSSSSHSHTTTTDGKATYQAGGGMAEV